ncbi:DMT family protein [Bacteriovorax sp. BSW11_IV]|uniref:DMT family protein n=1 Tax=Bacteriovorax sp. BSW11_IV TaxID=1353529 RepID=UPI00055009DD|nr:DMT family protein [Bacteriovorax sp. BSW11_IV]
MIRTVLLLTLSNIFMTFAWYGHLKNHKSGPLFTVIVISWAIAFFEYCFQIPANRIGSNYFTLAQLKIIQEVITMIVFVVFSILYMKAPITKNYLYAGLCLMMAVFFIFRDSPQ